MLGFRAGLVRRCTPGPVALRWPSSPLTTTWQPLPLAAGRELPAAVGGPGEDAGISFGHRKRRTENPGARRRANQVAADAGRHRVAVGAAHPPEVPGSGPAAHAATHHYQRHCRTKWPRTPTRPWWYRRWPPPWVFRTPTRMVHKCPTTKLWGPTAPILPTKCSCFEAREQLDADKTDNTVKN